MRLLKKVRRLPIWNFWLIITWSPFYEARAVQARRGDIGPLAPDHLREAYRLYQQETGRVGAARPLRSKRLFIK